MWKWLEKRRMEFQYQTCLLFFDDMIKRAKGLGYWIDRETLDVSGAFSTVGVVTPYFYEGLPVKAVGKVDVSLLQRKAPLIMTQTKGNMCIVKDVLCDLLYDAAVLHIEADMVDIPVGAGLVRRDGSSIYRENETLLADAWILASAYCGRLYLTRENWQAAVGH